MIKLDMTPQELSDVIQYVAQHARVYSDIPDEGWNDAFDKMLKDAKISREMIEDIDYYI